MFRNYQFQTKLFLTYSLVLTSIISIIFSIFYLYLYNSYKTSAFSNLSRISLKTSEQVDNLLSDMDRMALYVVANPEVRLTFKEFSDIQAKSPTEFEKIVKKRAVLDNLVAILVPVQSINKRISVYNANGYYISMGLPDHENAISSRVSSNDFATFYQQMSASAYSSKIIATHQDNWSSNSNEIVISLYRVVKDVAPESSHAIVEVQCYLENLSKLVSTSSTKTNEIYIYDENGSLLYSENPIDNPELINSYYEHSLANPNSCEFFTSKTNETTILSTYQSEFSNWTIALVESKDVVFSPLYATGIALILASLFAILFTLFIIFATTKKLTLPLRNLKNSIVSVNLDNLSLQVDSAENEDEIQQLNEAFDNMFTRIQKSMDEIVQLKANEFKSHLLALQSQVDPHFLYNMLSIINATSRDNNPQKVQTICNNLSSMLRYSSSYKEAFVSLKEEIEYTQLYMELMQVRFESGFAFSFSSNISFEEACTSVPKLTLQPFVENCFQHGFKNSLPPWEINIDLQYSETKWELCITDNGTGISEDAILSIKSRITDFINDPEVSINSLSIGGLGLINTIARLSLLYKENLIFEIEKPENNGCCITIGAITCEQEKLLL